MYCFIVLIIVILLCSIVLMVLYGITDKKVLNVTSYSSCLVSEEMLKNGLSTASTSMILTWHQVMGAEKPETIYPAVKPLYEWIGTKNPYSYVDGKKRSIYEVHDCKMLYSLVQCSAWNRKWHPFILC